MKRTEAFPSPFFKAEDVSGKGETYTIDKVETATFKDDEGENVDKPVIQFKDHEKAFILNRTNWDRIEEMHGGESNKWAGKKITLVLEKVTAFGKEQDAIRVKQNGSSSK